MENKRNKELNQLTKESIAFALKELMCASQTISISSICQKAGVSRNAYYRNFDSVDDVIIYVLLLGWERYSVSNVPPEEINSANITYHLAQYFYSEQEFLRVIKRKHQIHLVEELFRKVMIPNDVSGGELYYSYSIAYAMYGFLRAMIDNDFSKTPNEIVAMGESLKIEKTGLITQGQLTFMNLNKRKITTIASCDS